MLNSYGIDKLKICGTIIRSRSMFFYKKVIDKTNDMKKELTSMLGEIEVEIFHTLQLYGLHEETITHAKFVAKFCWIEK